LAATVGVSYRLDVVVIINACCLWRWPSLWTCYFLLGLLLGI